MVGCNPPSSRTLRRVEVFKKIDRNSNHFWLKQNVHTAGLPVTRTKVGGIHGEALIAGLNYPQARFGLYFCFNKIDLHAKKRSGSRSNLTPLFPLL